MTTAIRDPYAKYRNLATCINEINELVSSNEIKDQQMKLMLKIIEKHGLMNEYLGIKEE